jgi:hypothetical protein
MTKVKKPSRKISVPALTLMFQPTRS